MTIVIIVIVALIVVVGVVNGVKRSGEIQKGRNKCAFCGKRIKRTDATTYAPVCSKCGRTQPWAEAKS